MLRSARRSWLGHATLNDDAVSEYRKNGIAVDEAAVKVDSDNGPGDHAGNLMPTKTYLGGYPPAEVLDESTTFTVTQDEPLTEA
jgi:hypothetical protein